MAHAHIVHDVDTHFSIDPLTRRLKYESENLPGIVKKDHNSQVLTFEVPRYAMDGHDMALCNKVRVHYINIDTITKETRPGLYDVTDLQPAEDDDNVVLCSWPISRNATQLAGPLAFSLRLACVENGEEVYGLGTMRYDKLIVSDVVNNDEVIAEEYADILDQWEERLETLEQGGATDEQIAKAVADYLAEHPVSAGSTATIGTVNLLAANWVGSGNLYSQVVSIEGVTKNSQVDLTPSVEQLVIFYEKDLAFVTEQGNGIVTVYAIGQKPENDYTIQVTITEVSA